MEISIVTGKIHYMDDCEKAVLDSELGRRYFSEKGKARKALLEGLQRDDFYVALDGKHRCKGFIWVIEDGIFHTFPYIHVIAVERESRGQGVGKRLLKHAENAYAGKASKIFLVVSDFNSEAKKLYKDMGYSAVGEIPHLYRDGITECLMMKLLETHAPDTKA